MTAGRGRIQIGTKSYPIQEGMLFYLRPGEQHMIEPSAELPANFLTVHFSYATVDWNDGKWVIAEEPETFNMSSAQLLKDYYQMEDVFKRLVDCWYAKLPRYEFVAKTIFQQLLTSISATRHRQDQNYAISLKVERVIQHMHEQLRGKVTLSELAALVQLSPTYLSRMFKETTGYSVIEYFNKMKMDKAKELMVEGQSKMKEIARALGFADEFYFSRLFKQLEGISPSECYSKNVHGV